METRFYGFCGAQIVVAYRAFDLYDCLPPLLSLRGFLPRAFSFDAIEKMLCSRRKLDSSPIKFTTMLKPVISYALEQKPTLAISRSLHAGRELVRADVAVHTASGQAVERRTPGAVRRHQHWLSYVQHIQGLHRRVDLVVGTWQYDKSAQLEAARERGREPVRGLRSEPRSFRGFAEEALIAHCCVHLPRDVFKKLVKIYLDKMQCTRDVVHAMLKRNDRVVNKLIVETLVRRYPRDFKTKMDARSIAWACVHGVAEDVFSRVWEEFTHKTLICAFSFHQRKPQCTRIWVNACVEK